MNDSARLSGTSLSGKLDDIQSVWLCRRLGTAETWPPRRIGARAFRRERVKRDARLHDAHNLLLDRSWACMSVPAAHRAPGLRGCARCGSRRVCLLAPRSSTPAARGVRVWGLTSTQRPKAGPCVLVAGRQSSGTPARPRCRSVCRAADDGGGGGPSSKDGRTPGVQYNTEFGYSRKDVILIGVGLVAFGYAMYYGLQAAGIDALAAGSVTQLVVFLGLCFGWVGTYINRVANKVRRYACLPAVRRALGRGPAVLQSAKRSAASTARRHGLAGHDVREAAEGLRGGGDAEAAGGDDGGGAGADAGGDGAGEARGARTAAGASKAAVTARCRRQLARGGRRTAVRGSQLAICPEMRTCRMPGTERW